MSRPKTLTSEEARSRRLVRVRKSMAAHTGRLRAMTRLEQAAYKARASLGADYAPYTPAEREAVDSLNARIAELAADAERLNATLRVRLSSLIGDDPRLAVLVA